MFISDKTSYFYQDITGMYYILTYHFFSTASEVLLVVASSFRENQKWMNKQFKNDYHRRVKEASTQLHFYN